jgi:hypothetical protein
MVETKIGRRYRDRITGVVGTAKAKIKDPEGKLLAENAAPDGGHAYAEITLTQLRLEREHIEGSPESDATPDLPMAQDMRFYQDDRLEEVA